MGVVPEAAGPGVVFGEAFRFAPSFPHPPDLGDKSGNAEGRARQSRAEISSVRQKGRGAGPGRGGGRLKELGVPRSGPSTAIRGIGPGRVP